MSDAEVQAAMPKTRLQLREKMVNDGVLQRNRTSLVDLRSTSSRNKLPTQIGSSLSRTENRPTGKRRTKFLVRIRKFQDEFVQDMKFHPICLTSKNSESPMIQFGP